MLKLKILTLSAIAGIVALSFTGGVFAADGANLFKTKTCWSCHGKDAKSPIMPMYPKLAGQTADYAYNQMKDIKSGARNNGQAAAMKGVMGLVSDAEMKAIAEWLATQER
ncbi:MAG: cytochrome c [Gammaproteobacteria bacterium]|nr:cytochrome c [Gammaproteobacteria bacterium]